MRECRQPVCLHRALGIRNTAFALTCRLTLTNREVKERGQLTIINRTQKFGRCGRRPRRLLAHAEESKDDEYPTTSGKRRRNPSGKGQGR